MEGEGVYFMSEFMAAVAQYDPESTMSLEEIEVSMVEIEQRFIRLYQRYCELNKTKDSKEDKRKQFNPIRDMKISVSRAYQWAHRAGCDADAARDRVITAINQSLKNNREEESILWKLILRLRKNFETTSDSTIPDSVMNYINQLYIQYDLTEAEKKAIKKSGVRKKKVKKTTSI